MNKDNPWNAYSHEQLIRAHKFYMLGLPNNKQCAVLCAQIEHVLAERACTEADKVINEHRMKTKKPDSYRIKIEKTDWRYAVIELDRPTQWFKTYEEAEAHAVKRQQETGGIVVA